MFTCVVAGCFVLSHVCERRFAFFVQCSVKLSRMSWLQYDNNHKPVLDIYCWLLNQNPIQNLKTWTQNKTTVEITISNATWRDEYHSQLTHKQANVTNPIIILIVHVLPSIKSNPIKYFDSINNQETMRKSTEKKLLGKETILVRYMSEWSIERPKRLSSNHRHHHYIQPTSQKQKQSTLIKTINICCSTVLII